VVIYGMPRCSAYLRDVFEGAHVGVIAGLKKICAGLGGTRLDGDKPLR
jgi:hypothetical protein